MSKEMILSRQDVEFLLFDWLKVDELSQRPRLQDKSVSNMRRFWMFMKV